MGDLGNGKWGTARSNRQLRSGGHGSCSQTDVRKVVVSVIDVALVLRIDVPVITDGEAHGQQRERSKEIHRDLQ